MRVIEKTEATAPLAEYTTGVKKEKRNEKGETPYD